MIIGVESAGPLKYVCRLGLKNASTFTAIIAFKVSWKIKMSRIIKKMVGNVLSVARL